jgi:alpha-amylase/alpha-mannosidase (GH57 family)
MKIAIWVARRHRPFTIVEDDELIDIFMDLNNKVEVLSRSTVSRDVKEIFDMSRKRVANILKVWALTLKSRPAIYF